MDGAGSESVPGRVVPASDLADWKSGKDMLRHARMESQGILSAARVAAERASAEGYRDGYAAGLEQAKASCSAMLVALEAQRALGWRRLQPAIVRTLGACFARLVGSVVMPEFLQGRLRTILEEARPKGLVRIRTHGASVELVRQALQAAEGAFPDVDLFRVVADSKLSPDDLVIETRSGVVDGRLESQIAAIGRGLGEAMSSMGVEVPAPQPLAA